MISFEKTRKYVVDGGGLSRMVDMSYEPARPMGNFALGLISDSYEAWLVGVSEPIRPILEKAVLWIDRAIEREEKFGPFPLSYKCDLLQGKANALWALNGINEELIWHEIVDLDAAQQLIKTSWPVKQMSTYFLDDHLAYCFQAGMYETAITEFERYHGAKKISLKGTLKPREFAYALCLHHSRGALEGEDFLAAGRKMLRFNLAKSWILVGQYMRAVMWLKIVHWHSNKQLTPLATVLKAYEDMPEISPAF